MLSAEKKLPSQPIGDRSVQLLSYILYIMGLGARPPLFAGAQALWYEALSRWDIIEDVSQDIKTYPAVLYSSKVYASVSLLQGKDSKPPFLVTIPGSKI
ncbi:MULTISPECIES: hypothetical protein [unclassified Microcoleus]|uniref:hypothetical protein n=1 Tax=unclassified Microcoleus TaxID=2642155 RepID=UPI002FD3FAAB